MAKTERGKSRHYLLVLAVLAVAIGMSLTYVGVGNIMGGLNSPESSGHIYYNSAATVDNQVSTVTGATPWTPPTTTMQEPNYTGGTYSIGTTNAVDQVNFFLVNSVYSAIVDTGTEAAMAVPAPNGTYIPWLAASWSGFEPAKHPFTAINPWNGTPMTVIGNYTVNLRPGVKWSDWNVSDASDTYTFSNFTSFNALNYTTGVVHHFNITYSWPSVKMLKYEVQTGDLILTYDLAQGCSGGADYSNVANIVPVSNLTAVFEMYAPTPSFVQCILADNLLPYNVWHAHDYASTAFNYAYNCSPTLPASQSYLEWNMGYNPSTGIVPGLVSDGPFMMYNTMGLGIPNGTLTFDHGWQEYVNPYFFAQYVPSLRQYSPKIYSLKMVEYLSPSDAAAAETHGLIQSIFYGLPPSFLSTMESMPNTYIYKKPATGYGYMEMNTHDKYAPFNITTFRQALNYATNKAYIISTVCDGYGTLGQESIPPTDRLYSNTSVPEFSYNPAKAISLIKAIPGMTKNSAGNWLYNGKPVTADIQQTDTSSDPLGVQTAEIVASDWDAIGIPTTVTQEAFTTLDANFESYSYQVISLGVSGYYGYPGVDLVASYTPTYEQFGDYQGPFTSITLPNGTSYNGSQLDNLMNNLAYSMLHITNVSKQIQVAGELQYLGDMESTQMIISYPVDFLPFTNNTFVGISRTDYPNYNYFWYWNLLTLHERSVVSVVAPPPPTTAPVILNVGVVLPETVFYDGQYVNATIQVRNQYGSPVSGMTIFIGDNPSGGIINISSATTGVTNSNGVYTFEFQVVPSNIEDYTSNYIGTINLTATAVSPSGSSSVISGTGYATFAVAPNPVAYKLMGPSQLKVGSPQKYTLMVYNPDTGAPISNYLYTVQTLAGVVSVTSNSPNYTIVQGNPNFDLLYAVDSNPTLVTGNISTQSNPYGMAVDTMNGYLYVADYGTNNVSIINPSTGMIMKNITVGTNPEFIAFDSANNFLYVSNTGSNTVSIINGTSTNVSNNTVLATVHVGSSPMGITYDPSNSYVYVVNEATGNVSIINGTSTNVSKNTVLKSLTIGTAPMYSAFDSMNGYLYVTNSGSDTVSIINASSTNVSNNTVLKSVSVGTATSPAGIAFDSTNGYLYITNENTDNVSVLNGTSTNLSDANIIQSISLGSGNSPRFDAFDSANNYIYVPDATGLVSVINGATNSVYKTLYAGSSPEAATFDPACQTVYVSNYASSNLTVIFGPPATFENTMFSQTSGKTNSLGEGSFYLELNSTANLTAMGSNALSYVFIGNYADGVPVTGETGYALIGEMTTSTNAAGFGVSQPVEVPIQASFVPSQYNVSLTVAHNSVVAMGQTEVMVTVTENGTPVPGVSVTLSAQNAAGANRGVFVNPSAKVIAADALVPGKQVELSNPNCLFGSTIIPGFDVTTNASGVAIVYLNTSFYTPLTAAGQFVGFQVETDPTYLVPMDQFQISAQVDYGVNTSVNQTAVVSNASVTQVTPVGVLHPYIAGSTGLQSNDIVVVGNASYSLYVNATENTPAGPYYTSGISFTAAVSVGSLSATSGNTGPSGSTMLTYTAPNVSIPVYATVTLKYNSGETATVSFIVVPHTVSVVTHNVTVVKKVVPSGYVSDLYEYLTFVFIATTVVVGAVAAIMSRKGGKQNKNN